MKFPTEFNLYLIQEVKQCDDIFRVRIGDKCVVTKEGNRIYTIGALIPFIVKEIGCIGIIQIDDYDIDYNSTSIGFHFVKKLNPKDLISQHYWDMYMTMKELFLEQCERTEVLEEHMLPSGPELKYLETWNWAK